VAPHPTTDGTSAYCVDNTATDTANSGILLTKTGAAPATPASLCFH
jgi:hypothetical protein